MEQSRLIFVVGMHRTGSSVITRSLHSLGVELGDNLMPAAAGNNCKGFFEDLDLNAINERLLGHFDSKWHHLRWFEPELLRSGDQFADERKDAARILAAKLKGQRHFAFKDPRTAVLLPFWQQVCESIKIDPIYVIAVRNPLECARSLHDRDGFHPLRGVYLWAKHMIEAMRWTEGKRRLCIGYGQTLAAPETQLRRVASWLDLDVDTDESDEMAEYRGDFLDRALRHHCLTQADLANSPLIPPFVARLYGELEKLAATDPVLGVQATDIDWSAMDDQLRTVSPLFDIAMLFERKTPPPFDFDRLVAMVKTLQKDS